MSSHYTSLRLWRAAQRSVMAGKVTRPFTTTTSSSSAPSSLLLSANSSTTNTAINAASRSNYSTSAAPSLAAAAASSWWPLREPEQGTGFDNFLKRQTPTKNKGSKDKDSTKDSSSSNKNKQGKEDRKKYSSGGSGGGGDDNTGLVILATMIMATAYILSTSDSGEKDQEEAQRGYGNGSYSSNALSSSSNNSSSSSTANTSATHSLDLTWSQFLNVLEQDAIFKIVIHQGAGKNDDASTRARVYLKPGANLNLPPKRDGMDHHHNHQKDGNNTMEDDKTEWTTASNDTSIATTANSNAGATTPLVYRNLRIGSAQTLERKLEEAQRALGRPPQHDVPVQYQVDSGVTQELLSILPWVLLSAFLIATFRGAAGRMGGVGATGGSGGQGGMFGMGKSTAQKFTKEMNIGIGFKDVAGCNEAKREIMEFVEFLKTPDRFTQLGAKIPKGALLMGPPGTGKTLLAKAVAGEAGVPFYALAGSEFLEMFVGVGPSRVRDLFREARENAPCIIFIDEIDSIGRKRGKSSAMGGNDERENTLNQLLVEMDGFDPSTGVICLAGTNRDDVLDPALTRPGRFDRKIQVDLPDIQGRKEIFQVHLRNITLVEELGPANGNKDNTSDSSNDDNDNEDAEPMSPEHQVAIDNVASRLAGLTPGFSGADIANICNEAAIVAARRNADCVIMDDFEKATDRVIGGLESNRIMSPEERKIVAYHEAGHAVSGWFLEHADPLLKVTIIPRASGALGFAQYLPKEVHLRTQDQIMDIVAMALAGRAAEEVFFGKVTTGASDDLRRVTQMVYSTIQLYGMNARLGQLAFPKDPSAMWDERRYSEKTAKAMDEEAKDIVDKAYQRTLDLLREKKEQVDQVAKLLLEKETINHDDISDLIGERPFKGDKNYTEYVSRRQAERKEKEEQQANGDVTDDANAPNLNPSF